MIGESKFVFTPLGAGAEVGRSCMHIKYKNTQILMDIGIHPAYVGQCGLPFLDLVDLSAIDACFVTHFHLDHAGALPFLTEKTNFNGKVYMTHPTKAILKYLLNDYTRVVNASSYSDFYSEGDLVACYEKIIPIDYNQEIVVKDFKFCALNAGHVLGAAMFLIQIGNKKMLYTGDYSTEPDRHLKPAESPGKLDYLITEATYGVQCHLPRPEREKRFLNSVRDIIRRKGKVLLPAFALGRAQEILLILEEYWAANPELHKVPIFYASALAKRCIGIYQTFSSSAKNVSFDFKHVQNIAEFKDRSLPCVVMASPGMLQTGLSRQIFEKWCEDKRNGVIIVGYCVQGTLAKELLAEPEEFESMAGNKLQVRCTVDAVSFSAHVDYLQNKEFISECDPEILFFVHGEVNEMLRLKQALKRDNIYTLQNGENVEIVLREPELAEIGHYVPNEPFDAILKLENDSFRIMKVSEIQSTKFLQKTYISNFSEYIDDFLHELFLRHKNDPQIKQFFDKSDLKMAVKKSEKINGTEDLCKNQNYEKLENNERLKNGCIDENKKLENIDKERSVCINENQKLENIGKKEIKAHDLDQKELKDGYKTQQNKTDQNLFGLGNGAELVENTHTSFSEKSINDFVENELNRFDNQNKQLSFISLPFNVKFSLVKNCLFDFFDNLQITESKIYIEGVEISLESNRVVFEWESSYINDLVANSASSILKNIGENFKSIKLSEIDERQVLIKFLKSSYNDIQILDNDTIVVTDEDEKVIIEDFVVSGDDILCNKIAEIIQTVGLIFAETKN